MSHKVLKRLSAPHSTVEKFSQRYLPAALYAFLFGQSGASWVFYLIARALFGLVSGIGLFLGIAHNLPLNYNMKMLAGIIFTCVCIVLGALSSTFRCSALLVFPSMTGSSGRRYLMVLMLSVLYSGPMSNIQRNAEAAAMSMTCNLDLQVNHSRILWREAIKPFILFTRQLVGNKTEVESDAQDVDKNFNTVRDEVVLQYGYDGFTSGGGVNNTQKEFTEKTVMQCDSVVDKGVERCVGWFNTKWSSCLAAIPVPIINHLLCVPMRFLFLCDVLRVMTPWCRDNVPVEGNFGMLYDELNTSIDQLSKEFSADLVVEVRTLPPLRLPPTQITTYYCVFRHPKEEDQDALDGNLIDPGFTTSVTKSLEDLTTTSQSVLEVLELLLSFTFVTVFLRAFLYVRSYKNDILFDNIYITTYFRQIDARRMRSGKRYLLPLKKSEKKIFILPWKPKIYPNESKQVMTGLLQVISLLLFSLVLFAVDYALFRVLDIVSRNTVTQFNVTGDHEVELSVGGDTMMANLLRTTFVGFNSSSGVDVNTDNLACVALPSSLAFPVYVKCVCCILFVALFSFIQVYTNRLRRVISAFYFPKREKQRVLFLYNLQVRRRIHCADNRMFQGKRKKSMLFKCLTKLGRKLFGRH